MLARLCVVGVALGAALPAGAQVLADSVAEYSGEQGSNGWHFGYYHGEMNAASFQEMTVFQNDRWYVAPGQYWTSVGQVLAHPNGTFTSPPADAMDQWAARRWISDYAGEITIDAVLQKINATQGSNGVVGRLFVDGAEVWSRYIAGDDATGVAERINATVDVGSTIDFVVDSFEGNDGGDATRFSGVISAVPTPGSLALLGLAGILCTRRKRR